MNGLPTLLARRDDAGCIELELEVPADNPWFDGHFPGFAILPGVVQIGWAAHFGHALCGFGPGVRGMEQIKFKRPILPGARLILSLKPDLTAGRLRYEYREADQVCSSGRLEFGQGSGA
jgi:3-hydroxymyristoyl/3-hydroxydecanoyl-(acyl carrier protein) dehydratase